MKVRATSRDERLKDILQELFCSYICSGPVKRYEIDTINLMTSHISAYLDNISVKCKPTPSFMVSSKPREMSAV